MSTKQLGGGSTARDQWQSIKRAVHERDQHQCQNCGRDGDRSSLDVHHVVPRGQGGSNTYGNLLSLCRRCHDAAHGEEMAPTIQSQSTGEMTSGEFTEFRQFWHERLPTIAEKFDVRIQPIFDDESRCWRVPTADMRRLYDAVEEEADQTMTLAEF